MSVERATKDGRTSDDETSVELEVAYFVKQMAT